MQWNSSWKRRTYSSIYLILAGIISVLLCPPLHYLTVIALLHSLLNLVQFSKDRATLYWSYSLPYSVWVHAHMYHPVVACLLVSVMISPALSQLFILNLPQLTVGTCSVNDGSPHTQSLPLLCVPVHLLGTPLCLLSKGDLCTERQCFQHWQWRATVCACTTVWKQYMK